MGARTVTADPAVICEEYRQGKSLRELAADHGCSHVHIRRVLQRAGEAPRKLSGKDLQARMSASKQRRAQIRETAAVILHGSGMPLEDIASAFGHSVAWVQTVLKKGAKPEGGNDANASV